MDLASTPLTLYDSNSRTSCKIFVNNHPELGYTESICSTGARGTINAMASCEEIGKRLPTSAEMASFLSMLTGASVADTNDSGVIYSVSLNLSDDEALTSADKFGLNYITQGRTDISLYTSRIVSASSIYGVVGVFKYDSNKKNYYTYVGTGQGNDSLIRCVSD